MALSRQQSISLYGTEAYTGWGETEAQYDARSKGRTGNGGQLSFESEVDKAYSELGNYYTQLLDEAKGDINLALARLEEDYNTGKRFRLQDFTRNKQIIDLAQEAFSTNADEAFRTLKTNQLKRGINRASAFDPNGQNGALGIADVENQRLRGKVDLGQREIDLRGEGLSDNFEQTEELAATDLARSQVDLPKKLSRFEKDIEDERRQRAGGMALSRQQRAFDRFEASLI